jgi:hypothetical protein
LQLKKDSTPYQVIEWESPRVNALSRVKPSPVCKSSWAVCLTPRQQPDSYQAKTTIRKQRLTINNFLGNGKNRKVQPGFRIELCALVVTGYVGSVR